MNKSNNSEDLTRIDNAQNNYELFYLSIGSTLTLDGLHLYVILPLGLLCFGLNFLSFLAYLKINFRKIMLKHYFIVYSFCGSIISILTIICVFSRIPRYSNISFYFIFNIYRCKLFSFTTNIYLLTIILDCILLLERISYFNEKYLNYINKTNPYLISFILLIVSTLFNTTSLVVYELRNESDFYMAMIEVDKSFTYCIRNDILKTSYFKIMSLVVFLIRDVLTLLIEIILSIYAISSFNKYLKKTYIIKFAIENDTIITNNQTSTYQAKTQTNEGTISLSIKQKNNNNLIHRFSILNAKLTKMTIYLSICSIISHFGIILTYISFGSDDNSIWAHYMAFLNVISIQIKIFSNFFFFFYFNSSFRKFIINFPAQLKKL
jgi:hypothetical protein